jgi:multisubunit Na+/H+ antiporter MnhB subunit
MKHKIAAIILSIIMVLLIGVQLVDFTAFALSTPTESLLNPADWDIIGQRVGELMWSYRVVDVLVQVTLLLAAVIGASAMFRSMRKEEN